ncbi:lyase citrate acyl carrier gamma chain citd precursor signal direct [Acididesulfobacillus acetoxydans]|uniref:Lyase citrate acyl carrier gamma chain citd signal direct n=1 Tax=Acididesulfobacillus acetoxydans TaxID=1561005 RepID=A0A8S0WGJ9_9FIRM|nr:citrate lyase acyl carrier protein [Acididesulfobacillus acetoxydans]CAA7601952.1 lyase citrate acyl carrier gamma chain citd precursor signal direct [Acididesulfobacillus acetoxydans]CEJ08204.1 Malonate decarboxylase delta subunit (MdcD) [Acididesulfobacillus acetoxydans]
MLVTKTAQAGSTANSDVLITVSPSETPGIHLQLKSKDVVLKLFGEQIEKVIMDKAKELGADNVTIKAEDKGALDYTIRARLQAALERASN